MSGVRDLAAHQFHTDHRNWHIAAEFKNQIHNHDVYERIEIENHVRKFDITSYSISLAFPQAILNVASTAPTSKKSSLAYFIHILVRSYTELQFQVPISSPPLLPYSSLYLLLLLLSRRTHLLIKRTIRDLKTRHSTNTHIQD